MGTEGSNPASASGESSQKSFFCPFEWGRAYFACIKTGHRECTQLSPFPRLRVCRAAEAAFICFYNRSHHTRVLYLSNQTSSSRKLLIMLFTIIVQFFTRGCQQYAKRLWKMIGREPSSASFRSISQTSRLRLPSSASADCRSNSFSG